MTQLGWYLRRAIPWVALLGCCAGALVVAGLLARWPSSALVLLPVLVACCAAASAFVFDEATLPVVEVTPRGGTWRRTARLAVAAVPLAVWTLVVVLRPGDLPLARPSWLLVGLSAVALAAGGAGIASRRSVASPGGSLAAVVVLAAIAPVVIGSFLGLDTIYPVGHFPAGVRTFWLLLAAAALLTCVGALRSRPRT